MNHLMIFNKHGVFRTSTASWTIEFFSSQKHLSQTRGIRERAANGRSFHPWQVHGAFGGHNDCTLGHQLDTPESFCEWNPQKNDTPRKISGWNLRNFHPWKFGKSSSKPSFSGFMFIFRGVMGWNHLEIRNISGSMEKSSTGCIPLPFGVFFSFGTPKADSFRGFHHRVFLLGCPVGVRING